MAKVLIVDDSRFMRLILRRILEASGVHTVAGEAEDGAAAIEKYKELKPDAVTMDVIMPVESGIAAVKGIIEFDKNAKIVMVSAMGQEKVVEEVMGLGAKAFVVKPVMGEKLLEAIKTALGQ